MLLVAYNSKISLIERWGSMKKWKLIVHVYLPVAIGAIIYIIFRDKSLFVFKWIDLLSLSPAVEYFRISFISIKEQIPTPILYTLPDALWTYSFTYVMGDIWKGVKNIWAYLFIGLAPVCGVGGEVFQYFNLVPGTFDINDLIYSFIASVLAILFSTWKGVKQLEKKTNFVDVRTCDICTSSERKHV
jgi:hypothetical protein